MKENSAVRRLMAKGSTLSRYARLALGLGALALGAGSSLAQTAPPYVIYSQNTISNFNGIFGAVAADKLGNVFVSSGGDSVVYEYPANGGARVVLFDARQTSPQVSGLTIDANNNLYVTTRYDSSVSGTETDIFEFPFTSGSYPAPYTYSGSAAPRCSATSTSVCNYGQFLTVTGYYYQPQAIAFDGSGNGYLITTYDSYSGGGKTIFSCNAACALGTTNGAIAVDGLPTKANSLAAAPNGDLYWADGTDVYYSRAGSGTISVFDKFYENQYGGAQGVSFDRAGNLYVTSSQGTFEVPSVSGVIAAGSRFNLVSGYGYQAGAAVDPNGNIFAANYSQLYQNFLFNGNFGAVPTGTAATAINYTVNFNAAGTVASLRALQGGVAATEFAVSNDTCTGVTTAIGGTCTFTATFTPTAVGTRRGTVVLTDSTGQTATLYLTGSGQGTGFAVDPGTPTTISSTLKAPSGVAIDASGNVFVADSSAKAVYEYLGGTGTPTTLLSGLTKPTGVAVDSTGNLYVVDQGANTLTLYPKTGTTISATGTVLQRGLNAPTDVQLSGTGEIFISNTGANEVLALANTSRLGSEAGVSHLGLGLSAPTGIALDASGNLYVADTGNNRALEISAGGGQTVIGSGLSAPTGVAVEASGSVLVADQGNGRIVRVPNQAGTLNSTAQVTLAQPLTNPFSVRLNSTGTLFVTDNVAGALEQVQRTAGTLNFGVANVNSTTAAQSVVLSSTGTAGITLGSPLFAAVPAGSSFTLTASGAAPCASGVLATGSDCTLSSVFSPASTGLKSYTVALNTTAANAAAPSILLTGTGVQLQPVAVQLTVAPPTITYGTQVTLSAQVSSASTSATSTPTGTIVFNVDGSNTKPIVLSNGTATYALPQLNGGSSHTITASYQGNTVYASGTSPQVTFTVQPGTTAAVFTIFGDNTTPLSVAPTRPVSFSVAITDSVKGNLSGTVQFVSGTTVLGTGPISQVSTGTLATGFNYTAGASGVLPVGTYQVQAVFAGNGNYSGFTTPAQTLIVAPPSFSVVPDTTNLTATANQYGIANLTVTSYAAYQGAVDLTCSGLPANAYCIFRPALVSLVEATTSGSGTTAVNSIVPQTTQMQIRIDQNPVNINSAAAFGTLGLFTGAGLFFFGMRRRGVRNLTLCMVVGVLGAVGLGSLNGCGSGTANALGSTTNFITPAGSYNFTVTATSTTLTSSGGTPTPYLLNDAPAAGYQTTATNGVATIYTQGSTGFQVGQAILVNGVSNSAFNVTSTIASITTLTVLPTLTNPNTTQVDKITYNIPSTASLTATGGSVHVADLVTTQAFKLTVQ